MDTVLTFFITSVLIVISLIMPMTFTLVKNLLEQVYLVINKKGFTKECMDKNRDDIDAIKLYYYYVSFLMEAFVVYGIFSVFVFIVALLISIEKISLKYEIIYYYLMYSYWFVLTYFICREIARRDDLGHKHENRCRLSNFIIFLLIIFSFIIFLLVSDIRSYLYLYLMFALESCYLFVWVIIGWIWEPVSRLLKIYNY